MESITILGAGIASQVLIKKLRQENASCKISLIDKNNYYFPREDFISRPGDISRKIDLEQWTQSLGVEFINDKVQRVDPHRKKIYLRQNQVREFKKLIVATGLISKKMTIKGEHREGFSYLSDIDPLKLRGFLRISSEICVYVSTWLGLRLAISLASLGKEVKIVSYSLDFLGQEKIRIIDLLNEKKISLYMNSFIEEAVGEGMIKAVKISPLKVFSSQMVFIDSGFSPNATFFEEEVKLHETFFTDFEDIYFLGDINNQDIEKEVSFTSNYENAKQQATIFSEFLLKGTRPDISSLVRVEDNTKINIDKILQGG